jgi:hypothetical protein
VAWRSKHTHQPVLIFLAGDENFVAVHVSSVLVMLKVGQHFLKLEQKEQKGTLACENFQDQYGTRRKEWQIEPTISLTKSLGLNPP